MRIRAIKVTGELGAFVRFDAERRVAVIRGENSSGKSTLMNLIYFGLGGGNRAEFIPELDRCSDVYLEVEETGRVLTFQRSINVRPTLVRVFEGPVEEFDVRKAVDFSIDGRVVSGLFQDFMTGLLRLHDRQVVWAPSSKLVRLTWNQLLALVYVDQDTRAHSLFRNSEKESAELKRKRLEALLEVDWRVLDQLEAELGEAQKRARLSEQDYSAVTRFLSEIGLGYDSPLSLAKDLSDLETKRSATSTSLESLKAHLRTSSTSLDELRTQIASFTEALRASEEQILLHLRKVEDYQSLLEDLEQEASRVRAFATVGSVLPLLEVTVCPHCLQQFHPQPQTADVCPVCDQHMVLEEFELEGPDERLHILADKKKDIVATLEEERFEALRHSRWRDDLTNRKLAAENELNTKTAEIVSPAMTEMEALYKELHDIQRERDWVIVKLHALEQEEKYRKGYADLEATIAALKLRLTATREVFQRRTSNFLSSVREAMTEFLSGEVLPQLHTADIDPKSWLPLINGSPINGDRFSASDKVVIRLAFFYSLLATALRSQSEHPKLLLLDSPRDKDMDWPKFESICARFVRLVESSSVDCQVIITTSEVPEALAGYVVLETFDRADGRLLKPREA